MITLFLHIFSYYYCYFNFYVSYNFIFYVYRCYFVMITCLSSKNWHSPCIRNIVDFIKYSCHRVYCTEIRQYIHLISDLWKSYLTVQRVVVRISFFLLTVEIQIALNIFCLFFYFIIAFAKIIDRFYRGLLLSWNALFYVTSDIRSNLSSNAKFIFIEFALSQSGHRDPVRKQNGTQRWLQAASGGAKGR